MTALPLEPHTEAEEATLEKVARVLFAADGWPPGWWDNDHKDLCDRFRRLARAALAGESVTHRGEAVPVATLATIAGEVEARVHTPAEEALARVEALATVAHIHADLDEYATPGHLHYWHGVPSASVLDMGDEGLKAQHRALHPAIAAPVAGQHTTDEEGR